MASDPHSRKFVKRPNVTRTIRDEEGRVRGLAVQTDNTLEAIAWALDVTCPVCLMMPGRACVSDTPVSSLVIHGKRLSKGREFNSYEVSAERT